jgi:hypothetical protein
MSFVILGHLGFPFLAPLYYHQIKKAKERSDWSLSLLFQLRICKQAAQSIKLFYDFMIVSLDILAG